MNEGVGERILRERGRQKENCERSRRRIMREGGEREREF